MEDQRRAHLERAIRVLGGLTATASALGVKSHAVVHQWRSARVPAEHCPKIERETRRVAEACGDKSMVVTCEDLRDDVAWDVLRMQVAPEKAAIGLPT
jgi:DNA-binding transcriptional regulator YdaS (Cro superfamily)